MYNRIRHEIYRVGIVLTRTLLNGSSPLYVQASLWKLYYQFSKMLDYLREHNNDNIKLKAKQKLCDTMHHCTERRKWNEKVHILIDNIMIKAFLPYVCSIMADGPYETKMTS